MAGGGGRMEDYRLVADLVLALGAAFLGGVIARRLGQPVLLGYIVAGVLVGAAASGRASSLPLGAPRGGGDRGRAGALAARPGLV